MGNPLVSDELWAAVEPLLPPEPPKPKGGRPRLSNRAVLTGIIFVLKSGILWEMLPQELGRGLGMTCWRRLRDWQHAGVWDRLHQVLLQRLSDAGRLDWPRASPPPGAGTLAESSEARGPNPTDRRKSGTKRHLVVERNGLPLAVRLSAANVNDCQMLEAILDAIPPIRGRGGWRCFPKKLHADKGYDYARSRQACRARGIQPRLARRGIETSQKLGRQRWVVERTLAWLSRFRRLKVRYERRADIHQAFLSLGCSLICWQALQREFC